jgi:hypothetical protein
MRERCPTSAELSERIRALGQSRAGLTAQSQAEMALDLAEAPRTGAPAR